MKLLRIFIVFVLTLILATTMMVPVLAAPFEKVTLSRPALTGERLKNIRKEGKI